MSEAVSPPQPAMGTAIAAAITLRREAYRFFMSRRVVRVAPWCRDLKQAPDIQERFLVRRATLGPVSGAGRQGQDQDEPGVRRRDATHGTDSMKIGRPHEPDVPHERLVSPSLMVQ